MEEAVQIAFKRVKQLMTEAEKNGIVIQTEQFHIFHERTGL